MKRKIFTFSPIYKSTIWGGDKITTYKNEPVDGQSVGESWEISAVPGSVSAVTGGEDDGISLDSLCRKYGAELLGQRCLEKYGYAFPMLIKIIDTRFNLSVQVHPDEQLARRRHQCPGKNELWYMVEAEHNATITCGLKKEIRPEDIDGIVARGNFEDYLATYESRPGDCYFIPAGRIHCIGGGNLLIEVQQSSDITYRIYDFNRRDSSGNLRQLHTEQAKEAIDYSVADNYRTSYSHEKGKPVALTHCPYFKTSVLTMDEGRGIILPETDSFTIIIAAKGDVTITADSTESITLRQGHTALIAASAADITVTAVSHEATALITTC